MRIRFQFLKLALAVVVLGTGTICSAQPLVTEGLSVYYSFDSVDEDGIWKDGSGNGLNGLTTLGTEDALGDGKADIRLDTSTKVRGAGSAWFDTDANVKEDYIAVCDIAHGYIDNCEKADTKGLIPVNGFTVAAWVQVADTGTDQSVWQTRSEGGGFTHTQIQGNGNIRMTLRGDLNSSTLVNINEPPGGDLVPRNEWITTRARMSGPIPRLRVSGRSTTMASRSMAGRPTATWPARRTKSWATGARARSLAWCPTLPDSSWVAWTSSISSREP